MEMVAKLMVEVGKASEVYGLVIGYLLPLKDYKGCDAILKIEIGLLTSDHLLEMPGPPDCSKIVRKGGVRSCQFLLECCLD